MWTTIFTAFALIAVTSASKQLREFPYNFVFGTSTSAYQIEGAWNVSGKGENIWDRFTHTRPDKIADGSNADITCDSYHKIKEDVKLLKNLGVYFYRFSLSWSRLLPTGHVDKINPDGIRYYNELIDELLANNIQPMVILYHWDLPQALQDLGGLLNPMIADIYADYARFAFKQFGDRVKFWITFNEPGNVCNQGYRTGIYAPGIEAGDYGKYMCSYTLLLAHAKAYHLYDEEFRQIQKGKITITIETSWYEPKTSNPKDVYGANLLLQMNFGWFANPIFSKNGDWPKIMKEKVLADSKAENLKRSKLPEFSLEEINYIKGTADIFGLNHYTTFNVEYSKTPDTSNALVPENTNVVLSQSDDWESTPTFYIKIVPWGFRKLLNWVKNEYNNPIIYITENGVGDTEKVINDEIRIKYYKEYLGAVLDAIEDGCRVQAYTAWSLMDNFEWNNGYQLRFGLYSVDFNDPDRKRIPKSSAFYYKKVIKTKRIDYDYESVCARREEL